MTANKVMCVDDIGAVACDPVSEEIAKATVHRTAEAETGVFCVEAGGRLRNHYHTKEWDLFLGTAGEGEIAYKGAGEAVRFALKPRSFCAMPPGVRHEVRNASRSGEFVYLLVHAPFAGYDHISAARGGEPEGRAR